MLNLNYNATTIEDAREYMSIRYKELSAVGITLKEEVVHENKAIIALFSNGYGSFYILNQYRGQGLYKYLLKKYNVTIITFERCKIAPYLEKINCKYKVLDPSKSYSMIREYYGDMTTRRSGVPLMNHIDEGLEILNKLGSSQITRDSYCLHPLLQSDRDFRSNYTLNFEGIDSATLILTVEYRRVANSYLSTGKKSEFVGFTCKEIKDMLYADKVQNEKDFKLYHEGTHPRSVELRDYFNNWFNLLEIK
jgi:hypothetical protein